MAAAQRRSGRRRFQRLPADGRRRRRSRSTRNRSTSSTNLVDTAAPKDKANVWFVRAREPRPRARAVRNGVARAEHAAESRPLDQAAGRLSIQPRRRLRSRRRRRVRLRHQAARSRPWTRPRHDPPESRHVQARGLQRPHRRVHVAVRPRLEHEHGRLVDAVHHRRLRRRRQGRSRAEDGAVRGARKKRRSSPKAGSSSKARNTSSC